MPWAPGQSGNPAGRPPESKTVITRELKEIIMTALELAGDDVADEEAAKGLREAVRGALQPRGAVAYLRHQAKVNPVSFVNLVGKVLPLQVTGKDGAPLDVPHAVVFVIGAQPQGEAIEAPAIKVLPRGEVERA